ncbi:ribose/xylose/arabinose/galactoside ABC-type transport system permease subunit [Amaricoccus macauensis]|uniref:Ribose/xylose/arabinose/galactoside ABC-type transport system permease subunit n=1 Tax=Amaricoccus macauensis TaxID=57001 RepID=A0A840SRK1_9RHOB|nr:ABC transporter permease [Amaricoccus macauensis]MBB5221842.1 ribose/xylose/arabinose/galactoside ABC-type transport system permease subunit [Amaricoccus macauensis]
MSELPPAGITPRPDIRAPAARPAGADLGQRVRALLLSDYFVLYLSLAYFLALVPFLPTLSTPGNIVNLMSNMWPLLVVAVGQTFVLTIAGIDLSQGAVMGLTSVVVAMLIATAAPATVLANAPIWGSLLTEQGGLLAGIPFASAVGIAAMLAVAALVGLFNGLAVARLSMPPFMVTLVTMIAVAAFAIWLTQSNNIRELPESFISLGKGDIVSVYLGPKLESQLPRREVYSFITWPMVIALAAAVFAHILLNRTVFGRWVFAVGINRKAAEISGVPVARVIVTVFVISAVCAAIASILYTARLETGRPTLGGGNFLLDVIGATVIGGTSLFGGKGKVIWTFFGVLFFVLLSNTLNLLNLSAFHIDMVKGGVILMAALLDVVRTRLMRSAT